MYVELANLFRFQLRGLCTNTSSQTRANYGRSVEESHKLHEFFCLLAPDPPTSSKRGNQMNVACFSLDFLQQHISTSLRLCVWSVRTLSHQPTHPIVCPNPLNIRLMLHFKSVHLYPSVRPPARDRLGWSLLRFLFNATCIKNYRKIKFQHFRHVTNIDMPHQSP